MKYKVVTLGCRTNQYESQAFSDQLESMGYQKASDGEGVELCIVNTCTVTESADSHSRAAIRQLARDNPGAKIAVTGCFAERNPQAVREIEGVSHVIGNADKENLLSIVYPEADIPEFKINQFEAHTRAFVKVQDGCNSFCTYCIIPYVRGRSRSRSTDEILKEVEGLIAQGYQEVVLTGINIGDFEWEGKRLAELIRLVDAMPGLKRLRVSSIDPDEVDDELMDAIINGKNTCHSMHIVLQSGSNVILKRMNRKYTRQIFLETAERLRRASPEFTFTTDVIVGFPGETEADFADTLEVMSEVKFAKVHMFPYSDRPRTRANLMPNKVPHEVAKKRKAEVLKLAERTAYELRNDYIGKRMVVLTEEAGSGHTANFLRVQIEGGHTLPNQLVEVKLVANNEEALTGII